MPPGAWEASSRNLGCGIDSAIASEVVRLVIDLRKTALRAHSDLTILSVKVTRACVSVEVRGPLSKKPLVEAALTAILRLVRDDHRARAASRPS